MLASNTFGKHVPQIVSLYYLKIFRSIHISGKLFDPLLHALMIINALYAKQLLMQELNGKAKHGCYKDHLYNHRFLL